MNKRFAKATFFALITLFAFTPRASKADCDHSTGSAKTYLPQVRFVIEPILHCDWNAISWLGEFGPRHIRLNGTYGWTVAPNQFFKFGGEWLAEDLNYKFASGKKKHWINQGAIGAAYSIVCPCFCFTSYNFSMEYIKAYGQDLSNFECSSVTTLWRRIAGAEVVGGTFGVTALPWQGGEFLIAGTYDHAFFHRKNQSDKTINGFGAALAWRQRLWRYVAMNIRAEFRQIYDFVEIQLNYASWSMCGDFTVGLFANYTHGKCSLPNTVGYGIQFGADLGGQSYYSRCSRSSSCQPNSQCINPIYDVVNWTALPAVYIPEVLTITDQRLVP